MIADRRYNKPNCATTHTHESLTAILHYLIECEPAEAGFRGLLLNFRARGPEGWREGNTKTQRMRIPGDVGQLEALLEFDPLIVPQLLAVVCHPHPLYGGTLHNKVVFRAAKTALKLGIPALRFNFRGVGESQGTFDGGVGERDDVRAALDYLENRFPSAPVCVMGFSFGAQVGLAAGASDPRVCALVGLGLPGSDEGWSFLAGVHKPKLIVQGTRDQFGSREQIQSLFDGLAEPKRIQWVEGADHFFTGRLGEVQAALSPFLAELKAGSAPLLPGSGRK